MEKLIYNDNKLGISDINEVVTRVKIFLINSEDEIIIAESNGGLQLPRTDT